MQAHASRLVSSLVALTLAVSSGCERSRPPVSDERGASVRSLMTNDPSSLSLIGNTDRNAEVLAVQITDSLVQYGADLELQPRLAESWEFSEDRLTLTFRLRPGVRWHDGRPVEAADVVYSVELVTDPAVQNRSLAPLFRDLISVEAPDARTVRARYARASPDVLEAWRMPVVPRHLAESGAELLTGAFSRHPIGCGPFRFVRYREGEELVLEANEDYWDGPPRIDRLVLRIYRDQNTAFQALLLGELDLMVVTPDRWREALDSAAADRLASFSYYRLNVWQVGWNQDGSNPFFDDARVRRAMTLALDREGFAESVLHGQAIPAVTTYHPDLTWTDRSIEPWPHDPRRAERLLEQAGWIDRDGDGVRDRQGRPFRFDLMIVASLQPLVDQMAAWLQQSWAEVGVRAEIEKLEWRAFQERRRAHEFEAAMGGLSFTPTPDQYDLFHSSAADAGFNYVGFADPEVDELLERGRLTFDTSERRAIYRRLQRRLHELEPLGCLFHFATPVLHDRGLRGIRPSALDYWRTSEGPRLWYWERSATAE